MSSPLLVLLAVGLAASTAGAQKKGPPRAAVKPAATAAPAEKSARARIALVAQPPPAGVSRVAAHAAARDAEQELKAAGYELLPAAQLAAKLGRGNKVPACGDAAECLAGIGKLAGVPYVLNVALSAAGKQVGLKLTLVDTADSKIVSNIMSFIAKPQEPAMAEVIKKQVARVAAALDKYIVEEEMRALAALEPKTSKPAQQSPTSEPGSAHEKLARPSAPVESAAFKEEPLLPPLQAEHTEVVVRAAKGPGPVPFILMGAGATAMGIGFGKFGMDAQAAVLEFKRGNDPEAARDRAKRSALLCDITAGAGAALVLTGVGLLLFSESDAPARPVAIAPAGQGLALVGRF